MQYTAYYVYSNKILFKRERAYKNLEVLEASTHFQMYIL